MANEPLTQEQLEQIGAETEHASVKALKKYSRSALVGFLILLGANVFVWSTAQRLNDDSRQAIVRTGKAVTIEGCNRDFRSVGVLRGLLASSQAALKKGHEEGVYTQEQVDRATAYYKDALSKLTYPDCKAAGATLSSDPDKAAPLPTPLTPPKKKKKKRHG